MRQAGAAALGRRPPNDWVRLGSCPRQPSPTPHPASPSPLRVAYLAAVWASLTLLQLTLVAIPFTARRLFPKLEVLPSARKRFG